LHAVSFKPIRSNKEKYTAICNVDTHYPWRIHAIDSKKSHLGWWVIKKYAGEHTCVNPTVNSNQSQATSTFLVSKIMPFVKADLNITVGTVQVLMEEQLFIKISYLKAWRALSKAVECIYGDWAESYSSLRKYFTEICRTNLGSVGHVTTDDYGVFERVYWSFGPSIEGLYTVDLCFALTVLICMVNTRTHYLLLPQWMQMISYILWLMLSSSQSPVTVGVGFLHA